MSRSGKPAATSKSHRIGARRHRSRFAWALLPCLAAATTAAAADQPGLLPNGGAAEGNVGAPDAVASTTPGQHPLEPALELAAKGLANVKANIQDYSCTVVKRERIGGELKPHEYMFAKMRRNETVNFRSYEPLKEAIEAYLISSVKDMARIVTKSKSRDDEQQKKYSEMVQTMIDEYGYTAESAEEVLTFASNNLWRDS